MEAIHVQTLLQQVDVRFKSVDCVPPVSLLTAKSDWGSLFWYAPLVMVRAKLIAANARAPVLSPPNVTNARARESSPPKRVWSNAIFATAAASFPSSATNASVEAN